MSDKPLPANQAPSDAAEPDASKAVDAGSPSQADASTSKDVAASTEAAGATDSATPPAAAHAADTPPENAHDAPATPTPTPATPEVPAAVEPASTDRSWWWPRWPDDKEARLKLVLGGLATLLALQWWSARSDISDLRREVAQRLQSGENLNSQTKLIADRVDDQLRVLQGKVAVLEARQSESQNQQAALEQLYRDLAKNRDDWALAEIEQVLSTASQQLQLAGNVRSALVALQNADARLSRVDRPQFIAIRRAIAQDVEKLKSLPSVDLTGVAVRLDSLVAQVDAMPLLSDEKPGIVAPSPKTKLSNRQKIESTSAFDWRVEMQERWTAWSSELWSDLKQLMRIRTVTAPEALLLTPEQAFFARENVKLRLLNARVALLSRNDAAFRSDLAEADRALQRYFDLRDPHTRAGRELIRQIRESVLNIEMPTLSHSLAAVRQSRSRP
jgi:uroporphyrin-3 C-methyltransferase/uroporphyrinogen III methyltransferase/synthase